MPPFVRRSRALVALALVAAVVLTTARPAAAASVNDPIYTSGLQWSLAKVRASDAWDIASGEGITIAVVDSGIDLDHEDLKGKIAGQVSCIGANQNPNACQGSAQDDNGHGTHVAGIAAAATNNRLGMAGVAPDARILAVRSLQNDCDAAGCTASGTAADVVAGIRWAVSHGAKVINLSLGGGAVQSALGCAFCDAIEEAWSNGVISVVAAGNDAILPAGFGDTHAVVVTATTRKDGRASYSNSNSSVLQSARWPIAAPGGEEESDPDNCGPGGEPDGILSTYWNDGSDAGYACLAGTSMAAPHVSGALALLLSQGRSPQAAIERLLATATDLGPAGRDNSYGFGRIDLARAVGTTSTTQPPTTPTSTAPPATPPTTTGPQATNTTQPVASTTAPPVTTPVTSPAAPYEEAGGPPDGGSGRDPGAGLVAVAVAALLAAGAGSVAAALRLR